MTQIFLDIFSLHRLALGIKARQAVLDGRGSDAIANAAFQSITLMCYNPEQTITALEEHNNLLELLIDLLEDEILVRYQLINKNKEIDTASLIKNRDEKWDRYEFVRRMTAFEIKSLIVERQYN